MSSLPCECEWEADAVTEFIAGVVERLCGGGNGGYDVMEDVKSCEKEECVFEESGEMCGRAW